MDTQIIAPRGSLLHGIIGNKTICGRKITEGWKKKAGRVTCRQCLYGIEITVDMERAYPFRVQWYSQTTKRTVSKSFYTKYDLIEFLEHEF